MLFLSRSDVASLLTIDDCIDAVEGAFRAFGEGRVGAPALASVHAEGGAFHIKAAIAEGRFATKVNGNFFRAVPRIKGVIVLCDAADGTPLAVMDSIEITILRTGAATAVAAKYLAREDARTALICGCGLQGRIQARALRRVRPIGKVYAMDSSAAAAEAFAKELGQECDVEVVREPRDADVVITCTPSRSAFLTDVGEGTFVAAVGADSDEKQELAPALLRKSKVVADVIEQCATIGDLHHAIAAGLMRREDVHAELGEVVAGRKPGREREDETIIFDSTGMALQDVAAASIAYDRAGAAGRGKVLDLI
ncbi:MAG TPA: ornithine cyclodeaminase family protein [Thermoanaerobaculia bacterium]|nr:ornithine cyclodeaminase family protein [Thermoanaerobaculia bacterium]